LTCDFWAKNEKNNFRVGTKVVESVVSARANPAGRNTEILSFAQNDRETTDNGKRNSRSPSGMTARKAIARTTATTGGKAKAIAEATAKATANTGVLRFAQDDGENAKQKQRATKRH
jgi:hypothetical protein